MSLVILSASQSYISYLMRHAKVYVHVLVQSDFNILYCFTDIYEYYL